MSVKVSIIIPVYNVEKHIRNMLLSVVRQTFKDFEVIIINDGSTDKSQVIIDKFCRIDNRFKSIEQTNQGVASARNKGLEMASGEYIAFYDPDDYIPPKALGSMYKTACRENADIAMGIMKEIRLGESRCNSRTINLGKKKIIDNYDINLLWSFSVCNKLFRRLMIQERGIVFPDLKHAEDVIFLFQCIFAADKIAGCKQVVYEYRFRAFWEEKSATQVIKKNYLEDVIKGLDSLEEIILSHLNNDDKARRESQDNFIDEFYTRYIEISLLTGYYRQLWNAEEGVLKILRDKIIDLEKKISEESWNAIKSRNADLQLDKKLFSKKELTDNAILSCVLTTKIDATRLRLVLESLYDQGMPSFCVIVDNKFKDLITEMELSRENMIFSDNPEKITIATELTLIIEDSILFSKNSIRIMVNSMLKNKNLDFCVAPLKLFKDGRLLPTTQETAFTAIQCLKNKHSRYDRLDIYLGNKVFRTSYLERNKSIYQGASINKISNAYMIVSEDSGKKTVDVRLKGFQKRIEDKALSYVKNHFTKEEVRRIIKREI